MSDEKKRVLIVDDSADDIHFLMPYLTPIYTVNAATSGKKALEIVNSEQRPDIILMDVEMPEMNGYDTCRQIKEDLSTADIDVIFVSAHDTTEEKLAGYDAGGTDYLIKPVDTDELLEKIKLTVQNKELQEMAVSEQTFAMKTAMTAISSAGEQGVVIAFLQQSFETKSIKMLAELLVQATENYDLKSTVQIRTPNEIVNAGSTEPVPPLEAELLTRLKDGDRITTVGPRLILHYGNVSQLIKNMPDDPDKCGRLRDHLAILLEGAEARLTSLQIQENLADLMVDSKQSLQNIESQQKEQKNSAVAIMDEVLSKLEETFLSCGLTEEQEETLLNVVRTGVNKSLENFEKGLDIDEQLGRIIERLSKL